MDIPSSNDLLEIKDMLADHSRSWTHQWKMEGMEEGRLEGRADALRKLLLRKFGSVPATVEQRLKQASPEELETWLLNVLDAPSMEAVFLPPQ